ncbi:MAG TPA: glutamate-cysteine ligase family protein [Acidobacteriota bacterium]|nr:glutamate-cysteine ligase family protein [Acidobacteriota bacterium]
MGEHDVRDGGVDERRLFMKSLLNDVRALEFMLENDLIESGVRRIGAEQEVFLVNRSWHPAPLAMELLSELGHPDFTTELARFNLEFNLSPLDFGGNCLKRLEEQLSGHLARLREAAARLGLKVCLTGILPTLAKSDMDLRNMAPRPRYVALNESLKRLRGADYEFYIEGIDDLLIRHDNVMLEACNTSFQCHFQVGHKEFAKLYNVAQLVTAPLMAASVNSPLLFGKRLWRETRIALFQQSIDTRKPTSHVREARSRVSFGTHWLEESVLEIFREDISRFRVLLGEQIDENPIEMLQEGKVPRLKALCLHNGTVYRWNRPCYGISDNGKAHLRIENRVIPAGPSVLDAVANAAFYFGMMSGVSEHYGDVSRLIPFAEVSNNFLNAARSGLAAQFTWFERKTLPAQELICKELIPLAREGLVRRGIDSGDVDRYLGVLEERVDSCMTGSQWLLDSLRELDGQGSQGQRMAALVAATVDRQSADQPVHKWKLARLEEAGDWRPSYMRVEQFMTTDLFTVTEEDTLDLVIQLMNWQRIRHIPVEDHQHNLVGLISYRSLLKYFGEHVTADRNDKAVSVTRIMKTEPLAVPPETSTVEAMRIMHENGIGCLPVVKNERLVGVVTERDFMNIARDLLTKSLRYADGPEKSDPLDE